MEVIIGLGEKEAKNGSRSMILQRTHWLMIHLSQQVLPMLLSMKKFHSNQEKNLVKVNDTDVIDDAKKHMDNIKTTSYVLLGLLLTSLLFNYLRK